MDISNSELSGREYIEEAEMTPIIEEEQNPNHREHRMNQRGRSDGTLTDSQRKKELDHHEKVLWESKKSVGYFVVCALFTSFLRSSRTNVWILYARVFYLEDSDNIAWVLYGGTMFSGCDFSVCS